MCLVDCNNCGNLKENYPTEEEVLLNDAKYYECIVKSKNFIDDNTVLDAALGHKKGIYCTNYSDKDKENRM